MSISVTVHRVPWFKQKVGFYGPDRRPADWKRRGAAAGAVTDHPSPVLPYAAGRLAVGHVTRNRALARANLVGTGRKSNFSILG